LEYFNASIIVPLLFIQCGKEISTFVWMLTMSQLCKQSEWLTADCINVGGCISQKWYCGFAECCCGNTTISHSLYYL